MSPFVYAIFGLLVLLVFVCLLVIAIGAVLKRVFGRKKRSRQASSAESAELAVASAFQSSDASEPSRATADVSGQRLPYTRVTALLTPAEQDFFAVLREASPRGWHLFPQVRLANLIHVEQRVRSNKTHFYRIQAKCVDFVLCEPQQLAPQLVIELDDASHQLAHRKARDAFVDAALSSAGLPILHVPFQRRYDQQALAEQIAATLSASPSPNAALVPPRPVLERDAPAVALTPAVAPTPRWACRQCNAAVSDHAKYCNGCGAPLAL